MSVSYRSFLLVRRHRRSLNKLISNTRVHDLREQSLFYNRIESFVSGITWKLVLKSTAGGALVLHVSFVFFLSFFIEILEGSHG